MCAKTAETAVSPEVMAKYEAVIGLEVHAQLLTKTKIFCGCSTQFGDAPNVNTCPVCLGLPGTLPVLNKRAVELAMRAALALNCTVHERSRFARKNYFYPDLPKGYQISQYQLPLASSGHIEIEVGGAKKRIGITRLHLEEDAAKNLHEGFKDSATKGYVDYNRCGSPLSEIVSEPDMRTPQEAYAYLTTLRQILLYSGVSDCNMEEGSLRCDANVSVRLRGAPQFGTKVEVKNLNSFRFLQKALEYEIERHIGVIESGGKISQETRLWNQAESYTVSMRSKEKAHDYRYFLLTGSQDLADYFEATVKAGAPGKAAANWMQTELLRRLNDSGKEITASPVSAASLAELIQLIETAKITGAVGKKVFAKMFETGHGAADIVEGEGLGAQVSSDSLEQIASEVIDKNPENVAKFKSGNEGVFKFFVGQVIKATRGQANPQAVTEILKKLLTG